MHLEWIKGPPGTGKTTEISRQVEQDVARLGTNKVVVASLTRAAAREAARVVGLPERQVGTWHSLAYHALGRPQLAEAHLDNWNEQYPMFALSGKLNRLGETADLDPKSWRNGDRAMLEYTRARAREEPVQGRFADCWTDWKTQCGYVDFHDLMSMALDVKTAPGDPAVMYCDEAQDLSLAEARLIMHWGQSAERLVFVGDEFQSIFGWRGSDPAAVGAFCLRGPYAVFSRRVLEQSYRIPQQVHQAAMAQMRRCTPLAPVTYYPRDYRGAVRRAMAFTQGADLLRDARVYFEEGKSVMFIATCGYMLEPIMKALLQEGIAWHNPWRTANGRWNPLQVTRGLSFRERCLAFTAPSRDIWGDEARFWNLADVRAWGHLLPAKGIFQTGQKTKLASMRGELSSVDLATSMRDWFTADALEHILRFDLGWYLAQIPDTKKTSFKLVKSIAARQGVETLLHKPQVIVGTVHSLKGSQADVVYLCPELSLAAVQAAAASHKLKEEIQRVFYVAVTRAYETLVLCRPSSNLFVGF